MTLTEVTISFLLLLEIGPRLLTDGSRTLLAWHRRRTGDESELGVRQTGAAAIGLDQPAPDREDDGPTDG